MDNHTEKEDLVSIGEAAESLDVSVMTLRRWDENGKLSPVKSRGGHRYYRKKDIEIFLEQRRKEEYEESERHRRQLQHQLSEQQKAKENELEKIKNEEDEIDLQENLKKDKYYDLKGIQKVVSDFLEPLFDTNDGYHECITAYGATLEGDIIVLRNGKKYKVGLIKILEC